MKKHKIYIVGGGLTGLICALVLAKGLDIDLMVENLSLRNKSLGYCNIRKKNMEFSKSTIKNINLNYFTL